MWWKLLEKNAEELRSKIPAAVDTSAKIATSAVLSGNVTVGKNTQICHNAFIEGPVWIGDNCLIGNNTMIRGPLRIGDGSRIGFSTEIKNSVIGKRVLIGPQCFVADSVVEDEVYLGAMVRTSNQRLDRKTISVLHEGVLQDTKLDKLGCYIGVQASLGIQVIIFPGRIVAPHSLFGPRINIEKNLPTGHYMLKQELVVS